MVIEVKFTCHNLLTIEPISITIVGHHSPPTTKPISIAFEGIFDFIPLFDMYNLLSEHLVSWHEHMDLPTCQNIGKEMVWEHEMLGCIYCLSL